MKILAILGLVILLCPVGANAQNDSTVYINGLPVSEDDTVQNFPETDYFPKNHHKKIAASEIPQKLASTLRSDEVYKNWEKHGVYLDTNTKLYLVRVPVKNGFRIYGLNENGKPVTYDEVSEPEQ